MAKIPSATYRIQFSHLFTFSQAGEIVPYLHELGISDIYASPYFAAKKGSPHGYDVVDPNSLNPEVGTEEEYDRFVRELSHHGLGQILDIVPNHMCVDSSDNLWWMDVLENGPASAHAGFFDIDWDPVKKELANKILVPFLGDPYGTALENQDLRLILEEGAFFLAYRALRLPLAPESYVDILSCRQGVFKDRSAPDDPDTIELQSILTALDHLPSYLELGAEKVAERYRVEEIVKKRLGALYLESREVRSFLDENVELFNGLKGDPGSFDLLDKLLDRQAWRLSSWRAAAEEINYRRFFDISGLAALRTEAPHVFAESHRLVLRLVRQLKIFGLRVDHPDGLYDPAAYFSRLQKRCFVQLELGREDRCRSASPSGSVDRAGTRRILKRYHDGLSSDPRFKPFYIVGEKILSEGEKLPEDWPVFGTMGYDFLNPVNGIFVDARNARAFDGIYGRFVRSGATYADLVYEKKKLVMSTLMPSEIDNLSRDLARISERDRHSRDFTLGGLKEAITEIIACLPVYRTYVTSTRALDRDRRYIEQAVAEAKRKDPALSGDVFDFLERILLLESPEGLAAPLKAGRQAFTMRFQQITGSVMAKGVEDTVFYIYNRLVSLNEVGGNPARFGTPLETFHGQNIERSKFRPHALLATSTHDTKRSEDVRARLNVVSEVPDEWRRRLDRWARLNRAKKPAVEGRGVPDRNEEYLFYQTLVGAWPLDWKEAKSREDFRRRISDYMLKAVREAKVNTSWISPNVQYEEALRKFVEAVLSPSRSRAFLTDFEAFHEKISYLGMFNSLSQTLLKATSCGVPDFYQGNELWDFSLVDPDNRRPVDFPKRRLMLESLKRRMAACPDRREIASSLVREWKDGSIKLYTTFCSLNHRRNNPGLFSEGEYLPLTVEGDLRDNVCAFGRREEDAAALVVAPRFLSRIVEKAPDGPFGADVWGNTRISLPDELGGPGYFNIFTGETVGEDGAAGTRGLRLGQILATFPVALLEKKRT